MVELGVALLLGFGISGVFRWMLKEHQRRTSRMRAYRAEFFQSANLLIGSDCLTDMQLAHLRALADQIDKPASLRSLSYAVREIDKEIRTGTYAPNRTITSEDWASLLFYYFMALTYLRQIQGWRTRAMLANLLEPKAGVANTVAIEKQAYELQLQEA